MRVLNSCGLSTIWGTPSLLLVLKSGKRAQVKKDSRSFRTLPDRAQSIIEIRQSLLIPQSRRINHNPATSAVKNCRNSLATAAGGREWLGRSGRILDVSARPINGAIQGFFGKRIR